MTSVHQTCLTKSLENVVMHFSAAATQLATSLALPSPPPNDTRPSPENDDASSRDNEATPPSPSPSHDSALGETSENPLAAGSEIILYPHQRDAVLALHQLLRTYGCALLADEPGLGKTYSALFVGKHFAHTLVVAPASLRDMWRQAARRARLTIDVTSYETLSRTTHRLKPRYPLIIFDEAHYLRTPETRRYQRAAELSFGSALLFLSATPIHNRRHDLLSLFALALGSTCGELADHQLARLVVRRRAQQVEQHLQLPALRTLRWEALPPDAQLLDEIVALPPPLPPRDGGRADALVRLSLVRAWCSSDAALLDAIRRRLANAAALEHALSNGTYPSRAELHSWLGDGDAIQLGFAALLAPTSGGQSGELLASIAQHTGALRRLRASVTSTHARDDIRFARLRAILTEHAGLPALVFTHARATAAAAFRALAPFTRCALLTGDVGRVASGTASRREILDRFAATPSAISLGAGRSPRPSPHIAAQRRHDDLWHNSTAPASCALDSPVPCESLGSFAERDAMHIDVLIATDVVSEGVNLPRAGIVVHLDLPWTPARIEQRVGRARRLGSVRDEVLQLAIAPPVDAAELQSVVRHLSEKGAIAQHLVGHLDAGVSSLVPSHLLPSSGATDATADFCRLIRTLSEAMAGKTSSPAADQQDSILPDDGQCPIDAFPAAVLRSNLPHAIAVALIRRDHESEFVTISEHTTPPPNTSAPDPNERSSHVDVHETTSFSTDLRDATNALQHALAAMRRMPQSAPHTSIRYEPRLDQLRRAIDGTAAALDSWRRARDAEDAAIGATHTRSSAHRAMLHRISQLTSRGRLERRSLVAPAATLRALVLQVSGVGGETLLRTLVDEWQSPNDSGAAKDPISWLRRCIATLQRNIRQSPPNAPITPGYPDSTTTGSLGFNLHTTHSAKTRTVQAILILLPTL